MNNITQMKHILLWVQNIDQNISHATIGSSKYQNFKLDCTLSFEMLAMN